MMDKKDGDRNNPFNDEEFQRILHEMERLVEDAFKSSLEELTSSKTFVEGFAVRIGPDGEPQIDEFNHDTEDEEDLQADIIEGIDSIAVTLALPFAAQTTEIDIYAEHQRLEIAIDTMEQTLYKSISLPYPVQQDSLCYSCKNRVLDIEMQKQDISSL